MFEDLEKHLSPDAAAWWRGALARVAAPGAEGARAIPELFPALARRVGRGAIGVGVAREPVESGGTALVDRSAWRACDAAGLALLRAAHAPDATLLDLYSHGDLEERAILLRSLALLPLTDATARLLEEVQRSNLVPHFEAAICGSNLLSRAHDHRAFGREWFNRMTLKAGFIGLDASRLLDIFSRANPELSRMLQDLATEREAAGRAVWPDTWRFIARAPTDGSLARLIGGLEHGADSVRHAAADGALALDAKHRAAILPFVRERLAREPRAEIRALLSRMIES